MSTILKSKLAPTESRSSTIRRGSIESTIQPPNRMCFGRGNGTCAHCRAKPSQHLFGWCKGSKQKTSKALYPKHPGAKHRTRTSLHGTRNSFSLLRNFGNGTRCQHMPPFWSALVQSTTSPPLRAPPVIRLHYMREKTQNGCFSSSAVSKVRHNPQHTWARRAPSRVANLG